MPELNSETAGVICAGEQLAQQNPTSRGCVILLFAARSSLERRTQVLAAGGVVGGLSQECAPPRRLGIILCSTKIDEHGISERDEGHAHVDAHASTFQRLVDMYCS